MSELRDDVAAAIYAEGKASRRQGVGLDECPYEESHAWVMWRSGWRSEDAYIGIPKNRRETAATPTPDAPKPDPTADVAEDKPPFFWGVMNGPAPAPKPRRVPVQIAVTPETDGSYGAIVALADDGSMWKFVEKADNDKWERVPDLPQDE